MARTTSSASRIPTAAPDPAVLIDARLLQGAAGTTTLKLLEAGRAALPNVRFEALIDPDGSPLEEGIFDAVFPNAYAAGTPACFVRPQPGSGDHLFAARLLLRDDVPSVAIDPVVPEDALEREVAAYWLRRSLVTTRERVWAYVADLIGAETERAKRPAAVFTVGAGGALVSVLRAQMFGAEMVPLLSPRFGRTLFLIGNTAADGSLIELLRRFGGDVVLTTSCLLAAYGDKRAIEMAEAELSRTVPAGEMAQWRDGIGRPAALLLGEVAAAARELFVPSTWVAAEIAARYGRSASVLPVAGDAVAARGPAIVAEAAGLQAEACVWAVELLRFWGAEVRVSLDCPAEERAGLAALAERLGIGGLITFGGGRGKVTVVLAMRGGEEREAALVAAAARNCVASRGLVETIGAPPWVRVVPDQPSPPLLAAAIREALDAAAPDAAEWVARHDPLEIAARLV